VAGASRARIRRRCFRTHRVAARTTRPLRPPRHASAPLARLADFLRVITSVLSDGTIRRLVDEGRIVIDPWDEAMVQPASVDIRLGDSFRVFHNHRVTAIDLREPPRNLTEEVVIPDGEPFAIHPGEFVLGRTLETVAIPEDIVCRIEGKSSIGRLGLIVHATAGFVDPGFRGSLTLEITNLTRVPIKLYAGLPIAQLSFMTLDQAAERPYGSPELGSHYQDQVAATESRYMR
jgi:dCTP deaminase